jgi:hypothetical protein
MQDMVWKFVTPFLRHALSLAAGWFGAKGWLTGDQQAEFIDMGLALLLAGVAYGLSVWSKHKDEANTDKAVEIALKETTPAPGLTTELKVAAVKVKAAEAVKAEK